ncbi:MAG: histidine kinase dimerization/phospho-acceptor domain-containing protein, partial [Candidatus Omnitrophota bacterium]
MLKEFKLGPKFFLSLIIISIVPLIIISVFNYLYTKARLKESTIGHLRAINDSRAAHVNQFIRLRQEQAKEFSGSHTIRLLDPQGTNSPQLIDFIQRQVDSVYYIIKRESRSDYKYIDVVSGINNISVWDIYGNIVADTNRSLVGKKMPFEFLHILYEKGAYFMGFEEDSLTGEKFLTILAGVRNWSTEEYSGVVLLKSRADVLNDITTAREGLGKTAETYILDKNKRMITESRFVKNAILNLQVKTVAADACFLAGSKPRPVMYKNYQGRDVLGVQKYLPDQQWCVITEIDAKEAFTPVIVFRNRILFVVGCLIILILVLAHFAGRAFIRPILELRDASLNVARGKYDEIISVDGRDELSDLARSFNQMAKVLGSTTAQLKEKNKILEEQKEELKKKDQLKSEFVSMVSHELRTPMSIIKGSLSQLLDESAQTTKDIKDRLLNISLGSINRLTELINNLLDLSKIEAGKIELHKKNVDLVGIIQEVCHTFDLQAKNHNIEMRCRFSHTPIMLDVDKDKMIQIFINLIGNSL